MTASIRNTGQNNWHPRHRTAGQRARADGPLLIDPLPRIPRVLRAVGRWWRS